MPKRKRSGASRSVKRRRVTKFKKRRRRRKYIHTPNQGLLLAQRQLVKFRYRTSVQLNAAATAVAYHTFSANGMFDPDITGTGNQPMGFDQWLGTSSTTGFYNHYTVIGSKIRATFVPSDNSATLTPQHVGIQLASGATPITTNSNNFLEQKYTRKRMLTLATAHGNATVTSFCNVKKYLGVKSLIDEDNNAGTYAANPSEQVFFLVFAAPYTAFYDPSAVNVSIEITYVALLHEPRQLTGS